MPKVKAKKGDQNTTVNVINDIDEIIGDMNQTASQDEEELLKLEKIASEIDEAELAVSNIPRPVSPIDNAAESLQLIKNLKKAALAGSKPKSMPQLVGPEPQASRPEVEAVWPPTVAKSASSAKKNASPALPGSGQEQAGKTKPAGQDKVRKGYGYYTAGDGWCDGNKQSTSKCLSMAGPTWSQRLTNLSEHLKESKHRNVPPVVLGIPMSQFIVLRQALLAGVDILECAYQNDKSHVRPHIVGSLQNCYPVRGVADQEGAFKFVPCNHAGVQTEDNEVILSPEPFVDEEISNNGSYDVAMPSSYAPDLAQAGPSHFDPYGPGPSSARDPRRKDVPQKQKTFQTWSTKSSFQRNKGAIGTNHSRGRRVGPYKPRVQPLPKPQVQPQQPLPVGYYSKAKADQRSEYEKRILLELKQTQAALRRYKNQ